MIPRGMIKLYVHILKFGYKITRWRTETLKSGSCTTIIFELAGFAPEDPYNFENYTVYWHKNSWTKT